jgi:glutamyl-Q tRNA(Asp) synthetase
MTYVGRFAPSPSGHLHFGSLVAAVASYIDAKAHHGRWLVRIEDLDPPREMAGAATHILSTLEYFNLHWDGEVIYQSQRQASYQEALQRLRQQELIFYCHCSRQQLKQFSIYPGTCRKQQALACQPAATRVRVNHAGIGFNDRILGWLHQCLTKEVGDFVVRRRDRLFSYQLAVVVDDASQDITHVVRGSDLFTSTTKQIYLQQCLGFRTPRYAHIPLIRNIKGQKLSKQNLTRGIDNNQAPELMTLALQRLGHSPPARLLGAGTRTLLDWAIQNWGMQHIPATMNDPEPYVDKDRESLITHFQARSVNDKINIDF